MRRKKERTPKPWIPLVTVLQEQGYEVRAQGGESVEDGNPYIDLYAPNVFKHRSMVTLLAGALRIVAMKVRDHDAPRGLREHWNLNFDAFGRFYSVRLSVRPIAPEPWSRARLKRVGYDIQDIADAVEEQFGRTKEEIALLYPLTE